MNSDGLTYEQRRNLKRRQQRAILAAQRAVSASVKLLNEIRAETVEGRCPFCSEPIPPSRGFKPRKMCASAECLREYHRIHRGELHAEKRRQAK